MKDNSCLVESGSMIKLNWEKSVSIVAVVQIMCREETCAWAYIQKENRGICSRYIHISRHSLSNAYSATAVRDKREQWKPRRGSHQQENLSYSFLFFSSWILIDAFTSVLLIFADDNNQHLQDSANLNAVVRSQRNSLYIYICVWPNIYINEWSLTIALFPFSSQLKSIDSKVKICSLLRRIIYNMCEPLLWIYEEEDEEEEEGERIKEKRKKIWCVLVLSRFLLNPCQIE